MLRAQTVKDADDWLEALERSKALGQEQQASQGSRDKVPGGLESLRKVSCLPSAQCPVPSAQCPVPSAQCPVPSAQCPVPRAAAPKCLLALSP
jgi:hypothetical protein